MNKYWKIGIVFYGIMRAACFVENATAEDVSLGHRDVVAQLFSFPNNCGSVCFLPQTLEETIEIYLKSSLVRDGFDDTAISIRDEAGTIIVSLNGSGAKPYAQALPQFLAAGANAFSAAEKLYDQKKWLYNWEFFLPLGLPLTENKATQLLHFPPDYVLEDVQDYLQANTTKRWAELLVVNGADAKTTDRYQAIVDIAPIAAPSDAGSDLKNKLSPYTAFSAYIDKLLEFWVFSDADEAVPLIMFGAPVRDYVEARYGKKVTLLEYTELPASNGKIMPTIAANHPSMFYNALNAYLEDDPKNIKGALAYGMSIAQKDLIAACWEVRMAEQRKDGAQLLKDCQVRWDPKTAEQEICNIVVKQYETFQKYPDLCAQNNEPAVRSIREITVDEYELMKRGQWHE